MRLDGAAFTLVLAPQAASAPALLYLGERLSAHCDLVSLGAAATYGPREGQPDRPVGPSICPVTGGGYQGEPALEVEGAPINFARQGFELSERRLTCRLEDPARRLRLVLDWRISDADLLVTRAVLRNDGDERVKLRWLASLCLPCPFWARSVWQVHGRWGGEFQLDRQSPATGRIERSNRSGRSGHDGAHHLVVAEAGLSEERGQAIGVHLAWSGNARSFVERLPAGANVLQAGELISPGEVVLDPGEEVETPEALVAISASGLNGLRAAFHREYRLRAPATGVRRVHFNSWEAVYFDHDEARLFALAEQAAAIGCERFVLDDGWFRGRHDDMRGLGDWAPDPARFPNGLTPLIDHVEALGLDFGLWIEPEMVSPNSDLYRAHPDWCLHVANAPRPTQRNQLVLDLGNPEVGAFVFDTLDELLRRDRIRYLKWDHNRELFPAWSNGPAGRRQVHALYDLLDRIRGAHPQVEIESCAGGGGRVDFAIGARTSRFWPSDVTDPVERLRLQHAASIFYPQEVGGNHVGASPNPITGRRSDMLFRARAAMFAHMGVEADPACLAASDHDTLAREIATYKRYRHLIHHGRYRICDHPGAGILVQLIVGEGEGEALALATSTCFSGDAESAPVRLTGLEAEAVYRIRLVEPWPGLAARQLGQPDLWSEGLTLDGRSLAASGLRLPLVHPDTAWLVHLERLG